MPVRSLSSPVLKWPDRAAVDRAVRDFAAHEAAIRPGLRALGYFGSYARGEWGVGSDVDLVAVVDAAPDRFEERARSWDLGKLPVPADLLIYTTSEWRALVAPDTRFARMLVTETVWVFGHAPDVRRDSPSNFKPRTSEFEV